MSEVTSTRTCCTRPTVSMSYAEITSFALSPSGPCDGESVIEPSAPVNTFEFAISPPLLEHQCHCNEVNTEYGSQHRVDDCTPVNFVLPRGSHVQGVGDECFILHHGGKETIDGAGKRGTYPLVVQ